MLQEQVGEDYLHSAFIGNSLGIGLCLSPHSHISNVLWRMGYQQQLIQLSKFKEDNNRRNEIGDDKREPEGPSSVPENPGGLQHIKNKVQVSKHPGRHQEAGSTLE